MYPYSAISLVACANTGFVDGILRPEPGEAILRVEPGATAPPSGDPDSAGRLGPLPELELDCLVEDWHPARWLSTAASSNTFRRNVLRACACPGWRQCFIGE